MKSTASTVSSANFSCSANRKIRFSYKVNISTVINEILPIIRNEAILHNVTVEYESKPSLPEIVADRELLKQVFLNICKNGIEAMGEGGDIDDPGKSGPGGRQGVCGHP